MQEQLTGFVSAFRNRRWLIAAATLILLVASLSFAAAEEASSQTTEELPLQTIGAEGPQLTAEGIRIEISGAVASPAVVRLAEGARLIDAIEAAGGWGERVDPLRVEICLNLAAPLQDGGAIRVPSLDDRFLLGVTGINCGPLYAPPTEIATVAGSAEAPKGSAPINLNTATATELDALPGIGPATAAKIVAARKEARFIVVDDLLSRGIVSSRVLEQIRPLVTP